MSALAALMRAHIAKAEPDTFTKRFERQSLLDKIGRLQCVQFTLGIKLLAAKVNLCAWRCEETFDQMTSE